MADRDFVDYVFPHCDQNIVHAPGACGYCDDAPELQRIRAASGVNFTGERDPDKYICPAEMLRPIDVIERWSGNVPRPVLPPRALVLREKRSLLSRVVEKVADGLLWTAELIFEVVDDRLA